MFGRWGLQWRNEVGVPIVGGGALSQVGVHNPLHTMMEVVVGLVCFLFLWNPCVPVHVRVFGPQNLSELNVLGWYLPILGPLNTYPIR